MVLTIRNYRYGMVVKEGVEITDTLRRRLRIEEIKQEILKNLLYKPRAYRIKNAELTTELNSIKKYHKKNTISNITL
jgi:hypothetical protein